MAASEAMTAREVAITTTCSTAKEFVDRFFKRLDEERHTVKNMYEETGKCIFNGHCYVGPDNIGKLYENIPKSSTRVVGFDAHQLDDYLGGAPTILITVTGHVRYGKKGDGGGFDANGNATEVKSMDFYETFIITGKSGSWRIQSDNFRFQNCNTDSMLKSDLWNISMQE